MKVRVLFFPEDPSKSRIGRKEERRKGRERKRRDRKKDIKEI